MKKFLPITTIAAALICAGVKDTLAQDEPQPEPPPIAIARDVKDIAEDAVETAHDEVQKQLGQVQVQFQRAQRQMANLVGQKRVFARRIGANAEKSLVIRSREMDVKEQGELQEDLTVMTHILDKAVAERFEGVEPARVAMGINVAFVPGEGPMRSLYLDGYGALFIVNVNFPLIAPPASNNVEKEKTSANSEWEEARREVYGQTVSDVSVVGTAPEYDPAKITALETVLLGALKDASNIRGVKPEESITVCVVGAPSSTERRVSVSMVPGAPMAPAAPEPPGNMLYSVDLDPPGNDGAAENKTTLTIRVRKADADAFAKGKLTLDEFRKKAVITVYRDAPASP